MLLTEFFNSPEGDSSAKSKTASPTTEAKRQSKKDPCWKGYNLVGTKTKGSKTVPNCVPVKEDQWSGPDNAWSDGQGQWSDGVDQWHGDDNGIFGKGTGGTSVAPLAGLAEDEHADMADIVTARGLINKAIQNTNNRHEYFDFLRHLRSKYGNEYSTHVHQQAAKLVR